MPAEGTLGEPGAGGDPDGTRAGMPGERTDLAWNRSGLALLACGVALLKGAPRAGIASHQIAGGIILLLGGVTYGLGAWDARRRSGPERAVATPGGMFLIAAGTGVVGVAAF